MKELHVRLHHVRKGECQEIWEVQPEKGKRPRHLSRDTYGEHEWYRVCDAPYGYCERDYPLHEDIELVVCDRQWQPLFRDGNDRERFPKPFPTLEEKCIEEWNKIHAGYPHVSKRGFGEWILAQSLRKLYNADEMNWVHSRYTVVKEEILSRFTYLGEEKAIIRQTVKHTLCEAEWHEYFAGKEIRDQYDGFDLFFGYEYYYKPIAEVLETLRGYLEPVEKAEVRSEYFEPYNCQVFYFMEEQVGMGELPPERMREIKQEYLLKARGYIAEAERYQEWLDTHYLI